MTVVHIVTGLPASGKTTYARGLDALRFNLDDYRSMMGISPDNWSREREDVAVRAMLDGAKAAIKSGFDVVLDNTHLVPRLPRMYRQELGPLGVEFVVHDLTHVSAEECIERDIMRTNPVGKDVIVKMAERHADATKNGWRLTARWMTPTEGELPSPYVANPMLPSAIICDVDGTIALHGEERGHYEYDKVSGDLPHENILALVGRLSEDEMEVIFLSGREDRCRADTEAWIRKHLGWSEDAEFPLFMRKTGDHRPDYIVKAELFDAYVRDKWTVWFVLDDRDQVVRMWRQMGLTCLQVADGDF